MPKSTESPLQVKTSLVSFAFHVQFCDSPFRVNCAFPPERSSSITPPEVLVYVPSSLPPQAAGKTEEARTAANRRMLCNQCRFIFVSPRSSNLRLGFTDSLPACWDRQLASWSEQVSLW